MTTAIIIESNLQALREHIVSACARSNRDVKEVTLVAVTKYAQSEWVRDLVTLGELHLGESRPQQLLERAAEFPQSVNWHLIGHLQRNKARGILSATSLVHSIDSMRLLNTLNRLAAELKIRPRVLLEVNVSGEASKDGFQIDELTAAWNDILACGRIQIEGLMTMAPRVADPEESRSVFRRLRELRDTLAGRSADSDHPVSLPQLSMGMSGDFEIAIEEGSTLVRIGSKLFEGCGD